MVPPAPEPRLYTAILCQHFAEHRQIALLAGPRRVGKTTVCRSIDPDARCLNWNDQDEAVDPFTRRDPCVVPAAILLSMLP